jgi:hypothetical protein
LSLGAPNSAALPRKVSTSTPFHTLTSQRLNLLPPMTPSTSIPLRGRQPHPENSSNDEMMSNPKIDLAVDHPLQPGQEMRQRAEQSTDTSIPTTKPSSSSTSSDTTRTLLHIRRFLCKLSPPLEPILSRFIDLGFHSPEILREVANNWSADERRELLKRLAPGPSGKMLTELEVFALERGFNALRRSTSSV